MWYIIFKKHNEKFIQTQGKMMRFIRKIYPFFLNFLFLYFFSLLHAEQTPKEISFFELNYKIKEFNPEGNLIQIRGFLYETSDFRIVLATEPNLKSCCVGSALKKQKQILVSGDVGALLNDRSAITLKGNLEVNHQNDFPFHLTNAMIVDEDRQSFEMFFVMGGILILGAVGYFMWKREKK